MTSSMIRNQNDAKAQDSNIFSKNEIFEIIILLKTFEQQIVQQNDEFDRENTSIINHVFVFKITSIFNREKKDLDKKYQCIFAIKRKTQQAKTILLMKKQEDKN